MTDDLVKFLRVRLDEAARMAQAAIHNGASRWHTELDREYDGYAVADEHGEPVAHNEGSPTTAQAAHIAEHDPARVLAEVNAKRRILARYTSAVEDSAEDADGYYDENRFEDARQLVPVLRLLALPYRGHPNFQPEWASDLQ